MSEIGYWIVEIALLAMAMRGRREALMVAIFSIPFARRMPALPIPLLNFQNLLLVVVILGLAKEGRRPGEKRGTAPHLIPMLGLILLVTVSYLQTALTFEPPVLARRLWVPHRVGMQFKAAMFCLVLYLLTAAAIRSRDDIRDLLRAGIAGMIVEAAYITLEYLVISPGRATGHLAEPNNAGVYLACSFNLMLAFMILLPKGDRHRRYLAAGLGLTALSLIATYSRSSWGACIVGFAVMTSLLSKRVLAIGAIVLLFGAFWIPAGVKNRLEATLVDEDDVWVKYEDSRVERESEVIAAINDYLDERALESGVPGSKNRLDPSMQGRLIVWEVAFQMMSDYPLGVGLGIFPFKVMEYSSVLWFKASHNMYLKMGAEVGVPALLIFLFLLGAMGMDSYRLHRDGGDVETRALGAGALGYLVSLSLGALFIDVFLQVEVNGQFWMLMAAVCKVRRLAPAPAALEESPPGKPDGGKVPLYELVR